MMSRKLVAYFSASGVTRKAAETLAGAAGADLYEIRPQIPYSAADLNWMDKKSRSSVEMNDPASRPALADMAAGIEKYDVIFIGFPVWWYTAPAIIRTFLEAYDFGGKVIVPFVTSGGSGLGNNEPPQVPNRKAVDVVEASSLNYTILRPGFLQDGDEDDFVLTLKGEAAKGYVTTIPSVIKLAVSIIHDETLYARESVSITKDMSR